MTAHQFRIGPITIPPVSLGTMYFGTQVPRERALACLDTAYEAGAVFWDTANNYAFWAGGTGDESEAVIGGWLASRPARVRDQVVLATKVGARPRSSGRGLEDTLGLSRDAVHAQVRESLTRLRTDRLDVLYAHVDDERVAFEETLTAFGELVEEGLVRAVAASNLTAARLRTAMDVPAPLHYQALQQRFSYLLPRPGADLSPHVLLDEEVSALCEEHGLTRLGYSPLLSGAYTRADRDAPPAYAAPSAALAALAEVGRAHGLDAGQTVLAWMAGRQSPVVPVVGVSRPEQVTSAWRAVTTDLSPAGLDRLDNARHG